MVRMHSGTVSTSIPELLKEARAMEGRIPDTPCRIVPSSFDPADPRLTAIPISADWRWTSCERMLRFFKAKVVMLQLPLFWQNESLLNAICRDVGAPFFPNEPDNLPMGAAAIALAGVNVVIAESGQAEVFANFLSQRGQAFPSWFIIQRPDAVSWEMPAVIRNSDLRAAQEVHLFPGLTILEQCETLAEKKAPEFHCSLGYEWEIGEGLARITNAKEAPLRFLKLELPFSLEKISVCVCGRVSFRKIV
jgi:hypothetical protein